ncbi:stealth family protein [Gilliamella mensalis]|uniref:stealth family protein n=1 Tax=Gilliamella mensalis TaxID=1908520 RepID=UPI000A1581D7|nr:stealth family protein [Gilliamella mensalis]
MKLTAKTKRLFLNPKLLFGNYKAKRNNNILTELSAMGLEDMAFNKDKTNDKDKEKNKDKNKDKEKNKDKDKDKGKKKKKTPTYYQRVAINDNGQLFYERLIELCKLINIPFMTGAAEDPWMKGIHIDYKNLDIFVKMLQYWFSEESYYLKVDNEFFLIKNIKKKVDIPQLKFFDLIHIENEYSTKSFSNKYYSLIRIYFWSQQDSYSALSLYTIKGSNKFVSKLTPETFKKYVNCNKNLDEYLESSSICHSFPIDAVITWVDGDDPEWKAEKDLYSNHVDSLHGEGRATKDERFRNRNELKYLLRSLEMFAPFIRNIFIVTCGQTPEWLDINNAKIKLIDHKDIYKNKDALPTFNSSSIETQLHHIDGLSENFLYFNDDFMLTDFCTPEDFFFANGIMKYFPAETRVYEDDIDDSREEYLLSDRNAIGLIKKELGKSGNDIMLHCPYPSKRSLLYFLEDKFEMEFSKCEKERFRSKNDLRPIAFMQYHYGFQKGLAVPSILPHRYLALYKKTIDKQFNGVFKTRKYKTICINDVAVPEDKLLSVNDLTIDFLESYFPLKSSFEK